MPLITLSKNDLNHLVALALTRRVLFLSPSKLLPGASA